jgi:hypothetical protein
MHNPQGHIANRGAARRALFGTLANSAAYSRARLGRRKSDQSISSFLRPS